MSFGFNFIGSKAACLRELEKVKGSGDTSQLEAAKAFVKAEIEAFPEPKEGAWQNGLSINAHGHHDSAQRNVKIEINPVRIAE